MVPLIFQFCVYLNCSARLLGLHSSFCLPWYTTIIAKLLQETVTLSTALDKRNVLLHRRNGCIRELLSLPATKFLPYPTVAGGQPRNGPTSQDSHSLWVRAGPNDSIVTNRVQQKWLGTSLLRVITRSAGPLLLSLGLPRPCFKLPWAEADGVGNRGAEHRTTTSQERGSSVQGLTKDKTLPTAWRASLKVDPLWVDAGDATVLVPTWIAISETLWVRGIS